MPRTKKYASPADRLREFRKRQRAEKAQAALPSPEQIKERDEATDKVEQLSRAAGVPRNYPQSVWKRAAGALLEGEGRIQGKVKALRSLCAVDREWRKRVADWVRADQSEASKKYIAAQGWTLTTDRKPETLIDRMVACLEAGKRLEDHFTAEELESPAPADPAHDKLWADYQHYLKTGKFVGSEVRHGCNYCGQPATRQLTLSGRVCWFCERHADGPPTRPQIEPPASPMSPAQYTNSDFGKASRLSPTDVAAQREADNARRQRPTFGPVDPETSVFANRQD